MLNIGLRLSLFKSFSITLLNESPPKDHDVNINFLPDAVHAVVQPPGKAAVAEMVCASVGQGKEEDIQRPGPNHTGKKAQDVQLPGMEGPQNCVQEVFESDSSSNMSEKGMFR